MKHYLLTVRGRIFLLSFIVLTLCACTSKKEILYFQDSANASFPKQKPIEQKIEPNDILDIKITSLDPVASALYNTGFGDASSDAISTELLQFRGYLVNDDGKITLPVLGAVKVSDKSTNGLEQFITNKLVNDGHLKNPTVVVRTLNSKITVLGEVRVPGTYNFTEKNLTLLQAIGRAGDLTINGDRKDVMLIRQENDTRTITHIDLTSTDWFNTTSYFVKQNDVIVINPNKAKIKSAGVIGNPGTLISLASLLLTAAILFTR